jgi:hypothetical protein
MVEVDAQTINRTKAKISNKLLRKIDRSGNNYILSAPRWARTIDQKIMSLLT